MASGTTGASHGRGGGVASGSVRRDSKLKQTVRVRVLSVAPASKKATDCLATPSHTLPRSPRAMLANLGAVAISVAKHTLGSFDLSPQSTQGAQQVAGLAATVAVTVMNELAYTDLGGFRGASASGSVYARPNQAGPSGLGSVRGVPYCVHALIHIYI